MQRVGGPQKIRVSTLRRQLLCRTVVVPELSPTARPAAPSSRLSIIALLLHRAKWITCSPEFRIVVWEKAAPADIQHP